MAPQQYQQQYSQPPAGSSGEHGGAVSSGKKKRLVDRFYSRTAAGKGTRYRHTEHHQHQHQHQQQQLQQQQYSQVPGGAGYGGAPYGGSGPQGAGSQGGGEPVGGGGPHAVEPRASPYAAGGGGAHGGGGGAYGEAYGGAYGGAGAEATASNVPGAAPEVAALRELDEGAQAKVFETLKILYQRKVRIIPATAAAAQAARTAAAAGATKGFIARQASPPPPSLSLSLFMLVLSCPPQVRPLELSTKYAHFHTAPLEDADFDAKPMVLLVGGYSVGKTSFIRRWSPLPPAPLLLAPSSVSGLGSKDRVTRCYRCLLAELNDRLCPLFISFSLSLTRISCSAPALLAPQRASSLCVCVCAAAWWGVTFPARASGPSPQRTASRPSCTATGTTASSPATPSPCR